MEGKVSLEWDCESDPYATVGDEVLLMGKYKVMVTEIFPKYIEGYIINNRKGWKMDLNPIIPSKLKVPHSKYHYSWGRREQKRFISDKPRLEFSETGIKVWNTICRVAVKNPEDYWGDISSFQRS